MPRFVALLRGVSPQNCPMARLRACLEAGGLKQVRTVLSSGNAAFDAAASAREPALEARIEALLQAEFGRGFFPIVRSSASLAQLLASDPFVSLAVPDGAKRVVSFLRSEVRSRVALPLRQDGAEVICQRGREVFTAYTPSEKGPVFMTLIARAYGDEVTTRTLETVARCAAA